MLSLANDASKSHGWYIRVLFCSVYRASGTYTANYVSCDIQLGYIHLFIYLFLLGFFLKVSG